MARFQTGGKTPRITAGKLAERIGVSLSEVRMLQRLNKMYADNARRWERRHGVGEGWRPLTLTQIAFSRNPAEAFLRAMQRMTEKISTGVSAILTDKMHRYEEAIITAIAQDEDFLVNEAMQDIVERYQSGQITPGQILAATGGEGFKLIYKGRAGVAVDLTPLMSALESV